MEQKLKLAIIDKADLIARSLRKGMDCEIRKTNNGITISEFKRKIIK